MGDTKGGAFDVPGKLARQWLVEGGNPNGKPNSDVLKPWWNGLDVTRRIRDMWIVDFGWQLSEVSASQYVAPFQYLVDNVRQQRLTNRRPLYRDYWWRHVEPRPGMWAALRPLTRFIVTARVAKHRVFSWAVAPTCPDSQLIVIARDDDTSFGVLHSKIHELWALGLCSWLGVGNDPRYTPSTTFETFPFPGGMAPKLRADDYVNDNRAIRIAEAARQLNTMRENWKNPPELVDLVPEVVPLYAPQAVPKNEAASALLKKRTLTNLYNEKPQWLRHAHDNLDAAVASAYGWEWPLADDEILKRLFDLNQERRGRAA
jgi:type II restriction/modification system DNA methylase subunit YeeA